MNVEPRGAESARLTAALADRYELVRELGAGGMATVYLARDVRHNRQVALKVLHPELSAVLGPERFLKEIELTASLQHPHILPLFDSGEAGGQLFYVMPYVEGETLRGRLERETQLPIHDAITLAREVAGALQYAHERGVIHRDIKPENILLQGAPGDQHALVADFGIALAVQQAGGARMTQTGLSLGTPQYMAPEQAMGERTVDARADVYALGAVTYEMLAGEPPFTGPSTQAIVAKVMSTDPQRVDVLRRNVPAHVADAVHYALEKLPADRVTSARLLADALAGLTAPRVTSGDAGVRAATRAGRRPMASRTVWALTTVVLAATGVAAWLFTTRPEEPVRVDAPRWWQLAIDPRHPLTGGLDFRVAVAPDGSALVYTAQDSANGPSRFVWRRFDRRQATPIAGTERAVNPAVSPEGRRVAFWQAGAIRVVAIDGGVPKTISDNLVSTGSIAWADDGWIYWGASNGLSRAREDGGRVELLAGARPREGNARNPSALPDGRGVLFTITRETESSVAVFDARAGTHAVLGEGAAARYAFGHLLVVDAEGTLSATPFDLKTLAITGPFVPIATGLSLQGLSRVDLAIARDGTMVFAEGQVTGQLREVLWLSRTGTLTPIDSSFRYVSAGRGALSPNGQLFAFSRNDAQSNRQRSLWIKPMDTRPAYNLGPFEGRALAWSPDSRQLVFRASETNDSLAIVAVNDVSAAPRALWCGACNNPDWSADGSTIVADRRVPGERLFQIVSVRVVGDAPPHVLARDARPGSQPRISPNGQWVAYVAEVSGRSEVVIIPAKGPGTWRRIVSTGGGGVPRWSADGRELFYADGNRWLVTHRVSTSGELDVSPPTRIVDLSTFVPRGEPFSVEPHPDGQRFRISRAVQAGGLPSDPITVVQRADLLLRATVEPPRAPR